MIELVVNEREKERKRRRKESECARNDGFFRNVFVITNEISVEKHKQVNYYNHNEVIGSDYLSI